MNMFPHGFPNTSATHPSCSRAWTKEENKAFEVALAKIPEDITDRWGVIASLLHGRTPLELKNRYDELLHDVAEIESGRVGLPWLHQDDQERVCTTLPVSCTKSRSNKSERKKGVPWTEREHRSFLRGLELYGKGDWRSISRHAVISRTPTQVATHAQKYFIRQNSAKKDRKRASIHDITTPMEASDRQSPQESSSPGSPPGGSSDQAREQQFPGEDTSGYNHFGYNG